jgi:hypothetical protein
MLYRCVRLVAGDGVQKPFETLTYVVFGSDGYGVRE